MLDRQLTVWAHEWPASLRADTEIVIVDDGSPEPAWDVFRARWVLDPAFIQLVRIKIDKPWNQHGARNLGAHVARGDWLLMTDMDHVIPSATLNLVHGLADREAAYFFGRVDAPAAREWTADDWREMTTTRDRLGRPKSHVNSFALTRELYWRIGGYDEDYCGVYGTDSMFRHRMLRAARRVDLDKPLIRVDRDVIADASTTTLPRKEGRNPRAKAKIRAAKARRGESDVIKTLQFEWGRIL